jgi:hypothetical protein
MAAAMSTVLSRASSEVSSPSAPPAPSLSLSPAPPPPPPAGPWRLARKPVAEASSREPAHCGRGPAQRQMYGIPRAPCPLSGMLSSIRAAATALRNLCGMLSSSSTSATPCHARHGLLYGMLSSIRAAPCRALSPWLARLCAPAYAAKLGSGRIVASERATPTLLANLVRGKWAAAPKATTNAAAP